MAQFNFEFFQQQIDDFKHRAAVLAEEMSQLPKELVRQDASLLKAVLIVRQAQALAARIDAARTQAEHELLMATFDDNNRALRRIMSTALNNLAPKSEAQANV